MDEFSEEPVQYEPEVEALRDKWVVYWSAYESVVHYFQLLLIWEKPFHSIIFVSILHLIFWYLKVCLSHFIGLVATLVLIILWLDMWKHKIWPEIRAREPDPEADKWGELHPRVLTFPEICAIVASTYLKLKRYCTSVIQYRQQFPEKFVAATSVVCIIIASIGTRISGPVLAYLAMACCLLWPVIWHHRLIEKFKQQMSPIIAQFQHSIKKSQRAKYSATTETFVSDDIEVLTDSSSEDMTDIMGNLDSESAEAFSAALNEDDEIDFSDDSNGLPTVMTPQ